MPGVRQAIIETLGAHGALSLGEMAHAVNLTKMAARYHLGLLLREGLVTARECEHCGTVGRPPMLYALAEPARERLPKQYDVLAAALLDEIAETRGPEQARGLLRGVGRRLAATAPPLREGMGLEARLTRAAKFLSARGYSAAVDGDALVARNCPYRAVAREHPDVCELDLALVAALLRVPVAVTGGDECRFVITK